MSGVIIILLIIAFIFLKNNKQEEYKLFEVKKSDLKQEVNVSGRVEPKQSVDLAFERGGRVAKIEVSVGQRVMKGQILVELDNEDLKAQLNQFQAALESAQTGLKQYQAVLETEQANLADLKKGAKPEEIQLAETKVINAQNALADAEINLTNVQEKADVDLNNILDNIGDILNDAYFKADDSLNKQIDELFINDVSEEPKITFSTTDSQAKIDAEQGRVLAGQKLGLLKAEVDRFSLNDAENSLFRAEGYLSTIRSFLNRLNDALNTAVGLSSTTIGVYKTNVNTARNNINAAISNINTQKQSIDRQKIINQNNIVSAQTQINSAKSALALAQDELKLKKSGASEDQIKAQEGRVKQADLNIFSQMAKIKQAQAEIENIQAQLTKTTIKSPLDGTVVKQEAKVGEIVSANEVVTSIISEGNFEIKANIPEVDIAKIKIGDLAEVTLDAYGKETIFEAEVIKIYPVETIIEGIATYEITLNFLKEDQRIKSGMTADIDILTEKRENILVVPIRAVLNKEGSAFVKMLSGEKKNKKTKETMVKTGLKGTEGMIEILEGLKEGDKIIIP